MAQREFDLKIITTPILISLLRGRVSFPRLFLLGCKLTQGKLRGTLRGRFPKELIDLIALPLWVYLRLKERIGRAQAFEIMRIAILAGGVVKQNILFDTIRRGRDFETFIEQELEINRTGTTRWNTLEIVSRDAHRFELRITRCLFHELAVFAGAPEITPLICQVDNAVFNSYLPEELVFRRGGLNQRIADGAESCRFIWEYSQNRTTKGRAQGTRRNST